MEFNLLLVYGFAGGIADTYKRDGFQPAFDLLKEKIAQEKLQLDAVVTGEALFSIEDVLANSQQVADLAGLIGSDIILTPVNGHRINRTYNKRDLVSQARSKGFRNNDADIPNEYEPEAATFIFGKDGMKHMVIKSEKGGKGYGVHAVPGRKYGVSICYELWENKMDPETLGNISIIIHPAFEQHLHNTTAGRTLYLSGVPKEEIWKSHCRVPLNPHENSGTAGPHEDMLHSSGVPVVSANVNLSCTGVPYMAGNWQIKRVDYTDSHAVLSIRKS
jgi:hypothetical protein